MIFFNTIRFCVLTGVLVTGYHLALRFLPQVRRDYWLLGLSLVWANYAFVNLPKVLFLGMFALSVLYYFAVVRTYSLGKISFYSTLGFLGAGYLFAKFPSLFVWQPALLKPHEVLLPLVGVPYTLCRYIAFLMDFRAGAISNPRLITFLTYIFYFPAWISGPITRYSHFANAEPKGQYREVYLIPGLKRIVLGMVKKNFVAEVIAPFALPFIDIHSASSGTIVLAAYLYFLYLYLDFSGYTDLAVGSSKLLQVEIPENFNLPFLARNPQDFWFRWHISLSKWLNDYVFTPTYTVLLKTFSSEYRVLLAAIAIFITFAFSGFWHGEELRFIREGFYHATFLFIFFFFDGYLKKNRPRTRKWMKDSTTVTLISRFATFHYVVGSFMVFSLDFATLKVVLKRLMGA